MITSQVLDWQNRSSRSHNFYDNTFLLCSGWIINSSRKNQSAVTENYFDGGSTKRSGWWAVWALMVVYKRMHGFNQTLSQQWEKIPLRPSRSRREHVRVMYGVDANRRKWRSRGCSHVPTFHSLQFKNRLLASHMVKQEAGDICSYIVFKAQLHGHILRITKPRQGEGNMPAESDDAASPWATLQLLTGGWLTIYS